MGREYAFPPPRLSACCRFSQGTFAGVRGNGRDAPGAVVGSPLIMPASRSFGARSRYIRRLVGLAFLSPELVEAILQGRHPVELTATRLTELDLPLDWTEQHRLLAS